MQGPAFVLTIVVVIIIGLFLLTGIFSWFFTVQQQSRAIVEQMTQDEARHGAKAASLGGREPSLWIKGAMHLASRVMTGGSRWV